MDEEGVDILRSIYTGEEVDREVNAWSQSLAQRAEELLPGALGNEVQRIIDVAADCVYLEARRSYAETTTRDASERVVYLGLTPKTGSDDQDGRNPTTWMLFMDGFDDDGGEPENPCADR